LVNKKLDTGNYSFEWNAVNYPNGIYLVKIRIDNQLYAAKIIKSNN